MVDNEDVTLVIRGVTETGTARFVVLMDESSPTGGTLPIVKRSGTETIEQAAVQLLQDRCGFTQHDIDQLTFTWHPNGQGTHLLIDGGLPGTHPDVLWAPSIMLSAVIPEGQRTPSLTEAREAFPELPPPPPMELTPYEPPKIVATVDHPDITRLYDSAPPPRMPISYGDPINSRPEGPIPLFSGPPTREQAQQGNLGDCGIISVLSGVAGTMPDVIAKAVQPDPADPTRLFKVTLHEASWDGAGYVPTGTELELTVTSEIPVRVPDGLPEFVSIDDSAWAAVLEKAAAGIEATWTEPERDHWEGIWKDHPNYSPDTPIPEGYGRLNQGTNIYQVAQFATQLTGRASEILHFPSGPEATARTTEQVAAILAEGRPVWVNSRRPTEAEQFLPYGIIGRHGYEVVSLQNGMVQLHNPWGTQHPEPLDVTQLLDYFGDPDDNQYITLR